MAGGASEALTDLALGLAAAALAWRAARIHAKREWRMTFTLCAVAALLGVAYHGGLRDQDTLRYPLWAAIVVSVAVSLCYLLSGTVQIFACPNQARLWSRVRLVAIAALIGLALAGYASLTLLFATESVAMAAIVTLWLRGWLRRHPGAPLVLSALGASAAAALVFAAPINFNLGLAFTATALYHIAQIPGLVLLYLGVTRGG